MDQSGELRRVFTQLDEPHLIHTLESLDTVRALHQTVVALRKALENSQLEIQKLKKQINVRSDISDGKIYQSETQLPLPPPPLVRQVTFSDVKYEKSIDDVAAGKLKIDEPQPSTSHAAFIKQHPPPRKPPSPQLREKKKKFTKTAASATRNDAESTVKQPQISVISYPKSQTNPAMASKIGVKIRVSSNIQMDSSTSSEVDSARSNSTKDEPPPPLEEAQNENIKETETRPPAPDLQICVTSSQDDELTPHARDSQDDVQTRGESTSSNLRIDVDSISMNSMSEGDNSVFTEGVVTPMEHGDQASALMHDSRDHTPSHTRSGRESQSEHHEEVDDIELIFSSDDKELPQEDLVSISDYEPWQSAGASGTPVLMKYSSIPSDHSIASNPKKKLHAKFHDKNYDESSEEQSLERLNRSFDISNKSFDKDSSPNEDSGTEGAHQEEGGDRFEADSSRMGQRWKNFNVCVETDISKCGIVEENILEMGRRNTCPNPTPYRPIIHNPTPSRSQMTRCPLAVKFSRSPRSAYQKTTTRPLPMDANRTPGNNTGPKRSSSAQTEISALPDYWRSESHLAGGCLDGFYTLPSKFVPPLLPCYRKHPLRLSDKTQEARRVLLSDINFTSMVPELSRSADHLFHDEEEDNGRDGKAPGYYKGNLLKTPESLAGVTPSASMTSPGVSQWTVNDNSYGTHTTQTEYWGNRGDSFDSCKSYSMGSKYSTGGLGRHHRSRSVPSVRCAICKQQHFQGGMRTSESMHYTPRVTFQEPPSKNTIRGSLPDLRHDCNCPRRYGGPSLYKIHGDSEESTDSLLDEADDFLKRSVDAIVESDPSEFHTHSHHQHHPNPNHHTIQTPAPITASTFKRVNNRRCSENDIQRDYIPSKQSLPFLPKSPKCLKPGHLAKVLSKNGRVVIGRVRYVGPLAASASHPNGEDEIYIGLQLPNKFGDCDGTIDGRKLFECESLQGIFVPFKKVVMAWTS